MEDNSVFEKEPQWETGSDPVSEVRKIQKTIRRRNWKNIAISVILAAALLVVSVFGIIPWVESLYWNPDEITYRDSTDLEITLQAYTELFTPGYSITGISHHRTGFASYDLEILLDPTAQGDRFSVGGKLERNSLDLDEAFHFPEGKDYSGFSRLRLPTTPASTSFTEAQREKLRMLPEYMRVEAAVTFAEDLSMEDVMRFWGENPTVLITWVAVRSMEPSAEWTPFCGMSLWGSCSAYNLVDLEYRCFSGPADLDQESLEHHFMSLLQYSADQYEKGRGVAPYGNGELYSEILNYVKENGVKSYGVVITASPQTLLELMDSEQVHGIDLMDCWIDIDWSQI